MQTLSFGARMREARRARGLSQRAMARQMGITQSAVAQLELDQSAASAQRVRDVALITGADGNYLLGLSNTMGRLSDDTSR